MSNKMKVNRFFVLGVIISIAGGVSVGYFLLADQNSKSESDLIEFDDIPSLFRVLMTKENYQKMQNDEDTEAAILLPKQENLEIYLDLRDEVLRQNTVVVYPLFTSAAYEEPGFYTYYRGECQEECLTVELKKKDDYALKYTSSGYGIQVLNILGYKFITDLDIHKNPQSLSNYDKVIVLHSEYVTRAEFDAITSHPNVVYLYPNALYAEVEYDEADNTISLVRGHGFPASEIKNGFDWEFDNTHPFEYDTNCLEWEFYKIDNGYMLNCYPDHVIYNNADLLKMLKEL